MVPCSSIQQYCTLYNLHTIGGYDWIHRKLDFFILCQTLTKNLNHEKFSLQFSIEHHAENPCHPRSLGSPRPSLGGSQRGHSMQPPHNSFSQVEFGSYIHNLLDVLNKVFVIVQVLALSEPGVGRAEDQVALRLYSRTARIALP